MPAASSHPTLPLPDRQPICPHFGVCGGCQSQDRSYPLQVKAKDEWLHSLFQELIPAESWLPFLASREEYPTYFRNKIRFSFVGEDGVIRPSRHRVGDDAAEVAISQCFLQSETSTAVAVFTAGFALSHSWELFDAQTSRGWLKHILMREGKKTGELMVCLVTTEGKDSLADEWAEAIQRQFPQVTSMYQTLTHDRNNFDSTDRHLLGEEAIHEQIGGYLFRVSPHAFFQTNSEMVETLYGAIRTSLGTSGAQRLWDLYAGSATIGIFLHDLAEQVVSIESNAQNISDADWNISENKIGNLEMIEGSVESVCTSAFINQYGPPDAIVVDPPRAGLSEKTRSLLGGLRADRLTYVSCNPITCLRDSRDLIRLGYRLISLQGVDMFPHTLHCEIVATFGRT
ncbi:MAG: 23S rRNA (uracil(1939)-C(5))-methyltransferase RlmD [bacterium]